ncbi:GFA family protein [Pelagibacterium xiamenense]|uniref:GFA family protein n=1 Tax=Pelagibacterium xiamenense TaxID=2901140 RepID=UPI001E337C8F|nr:GFA family protein [Pelagibacterium xiamenense]MCD7059404.1 GFA family protein [Pelagibacterium xiamenense]
MTQQRYRGSCQCGAVTYEALLSLDQAITCNCSRCQRMGFVLTFTPRENFDLKSGMENLTEYRFNTGTIRHQFCSTCGVESFALGEMPDGAQIAAVNVNCLEGVDPRALATQAVDGRSA